MIAKQANTLEVSGVLNFSNASEQLEQGVEQLQGVQVVDLSKLESTDSTAIAVLLAWTRNALKQGVELKLQGAPQSLRALVEVYGLQEILIFH